MPMGQAMELHRTLQRLDRIALIQAFGAVAQERTRRRRDVRVRCAPQKIIEEETQIDRR